MITIYNTGEDFLNDNKEYLDTNEYLACFFYWDAPLLKNANNINYAIKVEIENRKLLALKQEPYNLLLFGDKELSRELLLFLVENQYEVKNMLGPEDVCDSLVSIFEKDYGITYHEALAMDFMETKEIVEESSREIVRAEAKDLDEICELLENFIKDCGLIDKVYKDKIAATLDNYRLIKIDGKIVSMAKICYGTKTAQKLTDVYTRPEYRGLGYARKVVNYCKNEIIQNGFIATLNVDKKNPISNKLYYDLGFRKVFSQGEYRRK